jgi:simple sugar transport system permease protein
MLMGAFCGYAAAYGTGSPWIGLLAAFAAGVLMGLIHAFLSVSLGGNQVVSGLALTMFGTGISSLMGRRYVGTTIPGIGKLEIPWLCDIPFVGQAFFSQDILVYLSFVLVFAIYFFLRRTRPGLDLRAVGDNPQAAEAMGISAARIRYFYTLLGAGIVALGGAYMSLVYNKFWAEMMTAGRGWIAVAMVIFSIWNPLQAALGAYLFGGVEALQLRLQAAGATVPTALLLMAPYLMTLFVLVVISICKGRGILLSAPSALARPYFREDR